MRKPTMISVAALLAACTSVRAAQMQVTWTDQGNDADWTNSASWGLASGYPDNNHPPGTTYAVTLNGSTTINGINPTIDSLIFHGTLTGSGGLTVNGPLTWNGGTLSLALGVTVLGGSIQNYPVLPILGNTLTNSAGGTLTIAPGDDTQVLQLASGAALINNGTVVLQTGTLALSGNSTQTAASFVNNGTLVVQDLDGPSAALANSNDGGYGTFQNNGKVDVQTGTFDVAVSPAGPSSGTFNIAAGATLVLGQPYTFASGAQVTGTGVVSLYTGTFQGPITFGGTLQANTLEIDDAASVANLIMSGGTISGSGTLTLTGVSTIDNSSATVHSLVFAGTTTLSASSLHNTFDGTAAAIASGGVVNMQGLLGLMLKNGATLTNNGTLSGSTASIQGFGTAVGASGTFTNNGVINASAFAVDQLITFNNNGTLILGNGSGIAGPGIDGPTSYVHNVTGLLRLTDAHPFLRGTLQTDGYVQVSLPTGSSTTLGSALTFKHTGTLDVHQGTLILAAAQDAATTGLFQVDAAGILEFAASYDFSSVPTLTGTGTVIIDPGVTLTVPADVDFTGTIELNGTLLVAAPRDPNADPGSLLQFTVTGGAVPEPASLAMLGLGGTLLIGRRRTRRRCVRT